MARRKLKEFPDFKNEKCDGSSIIHDNHIFIYVGRMIDYGYLLTIKDYNKDFEYENDVIYSKAHIQPATVNNHLRDYGYKISVK